MTYTATQKRFILVAAIAASSMGFIDGSVISIVTPAIRSTLGASLADAQWVANGYLLTLSSLLLLGGAVGDRYGLRNVFVGGIVLFVLASLVSAAAPNVGFLIGARVVQGIGAAFMVPGSLAIIASAYPEGERGGAIGLWAAASSLTTLLGPVFGGALLSWVGEASWRLVFALNLPLGGIALALLLATPATPRGGDKRLDIAGAVLATLGLLLISWALIEASSPLFLPALLGGIVVLVAFLVWEARTSATPMLPLALFRERSFSAAQAATFLLSVSLAAITFYLPTLLIAGWRVTPAETAIVMLPLGIALTILSPPAGRLADRLGPGPVIAGGATLVALAFAGLGLTAPWHSLWVAVLPLMALFGIGMSGVAGPISTAVMAAAPAGQTGTASAINNAVARVAGLLAVALMGSIAAFVYRGAGTANLPPFGAEAPVASIAPDLDALRIAATDSAFAVIAYLSAALTLCGAVTVGLTGRKDSGSI